MGIAGRGQAGITSSSAPFRIVTHVGDEPQIFIMFKVKGRDDVRQPFRVVVGDFAQVNGKLFNERMAPTFVGKSV